MDHLDPIETFRAGAVSISIFRREQTGPTGKFMSYNCVVQNTFTNKVSGQLDNNSSFNPTGLDVLMLLLDKAIRWIDEDKKTTNPWPLTEPEQGE